MISSEPTLKCLDLRLLQGTNCLNFGGSASMTVMSAAIVGHFKALLLPAMYSKT